MIAVADTSPVCYLIPIGEIDVLPPLAACGSLGSWVPPLATAGLERLQAGERAAILLAESTMASIVLLDEKAARRVAATRGLRVTGILGVLGEAATRGLLELASAIDRLRMTSFRASPALLKTTLDRFGTR